MRKTSLLFLLCLLLVGPLQAQRNQNNSITDLTRDQIRCYTVDADIQMRQKHPEMGTMEEFEQWLAPKVAEWKQRNATNQRAAVTTIPIIFHVIHNGGADNISATYVNAQIDQLNNDFRRVSGTSGYNTNPNGADTEIEFCAATVAPNGSTLSEPGINRISRSSAGFSTPPYTTNYIDATIKPATYWDPDSYCNIWVCNISGGTLGYAQFPSNSGLAGLSSNGGGASTDGVVVRYTSLGSTTTPYPGAAPYNEGRTLTHEIGHWLGLRHIWGDGGCSVDDYCGDTPQSDASNFGCPTNHVSCSTIDMVQNYMDYTDDDCMNIFTNDQKARMQAVLANSLRRDFTSSNGCGGGNPGGSSCTGTTITAFPYTEGFESSWGAWTQGSGDDFDWSRLSGSTPSSNTGPASAAAGSFYVYTEASSPNYPSKVAILNSPCFDLTGKTTATFDFQYHLYGATAMGGLVLEARADGGSWATVWSATGNQGNAWNAGTADLNAYTGDIVQLRFVGTTGTTWQGDMAVDDVSLTATTGGGTSCTGAIRSFPYAESFEAGWGAWSQVTGDDFDWSRISGGTPSSNTGPASAAAGSWYVYTEASSPNYPSKSAILEGPCFDLSGATQASFTFQYHNYGAATMGGMVLEASTNNGSSWTSIWSVTGNQGNAWASAAVDLASYVGGSVKLRFVGTTSNTWQGDMAIDDIGLSTGGGTGGCNDVTLTLTFDNYPEETSWEIKDGATVIASGGTYGSEPDGSTLVLTECLDDGCYDFIINDAYGDGMCCTYGNGSYLLQAGTTTLASGGSYTSSETTAFCVSGGNRGISSSAQSTQAAQSNFSELLLFPNPTSGALNVRLESDLASQADARIVDIMGRVVWSQNWEMQEGKNGYDLDLSHLASGQYMLVVAQGESVISRRIVVEK